MRNTFLITAILSCLATAAVAAEQKQDAQPQSQQAEQTQMARTDPDGSMDQVSSPKRDCTPRAARHSRRKNQQEDAKGDPQAPQNQVEYGGAG